MAPQNVGIKAIEIYFPNRYVAQTDLEAFLGASMGKYTIGLGQASMSFCDDREARCVLMPLFGASTDIEGIDTYNACYGGTSALFNAAHWVESAAWDGRDAIVVASDIALYSEPATRPTGGAGCVAMLIDPNAPLVLEPLRASHMAHTYDFYRPDFKAEYPVVDGRLSSRCYLQALDSCYRRYQNKKAIMVGESNGLLEPTWTEQTKTALDEFDFFIFHAPNCKLVAKAYGRLLYNDLDANPDHPLLTSEIVPPSTREQTYEASLDDKGLEKTLMRLTQEQFRERVQPSLTGPSMCGNMYTARVYPGLVSLLNNIPNEQLAGHRVGIFSFGSGLTSTLFSLRVVGDVSGLAAKTNLHARLAGRERVSPAFYDEMCRLRESAYQKSNYTPVGSVDALAPGTYYLEHVDEMFRRTYRIKE
ncbi:Hydroxymethylglutaryl-CoA synthase [Penicillium hispanicum]|uniref:Hydroxymethylglutaryl-CoA synthase n=1 Tax=Penicillium hispanicum TaxID=1080232 RepID=UPI002542063E|nr:Hydroxymethylglutaryl-CoA synthase [Penicillium hispanicum]KAJ5578661.1 Hydroxymethylglutaryl-CoA synthase [Penicillium hispanicum]